MLTLIQLYDLAKNVDIDLFEGLTLPEGSPLDRNTMINDILMRCGLNYPNFADPYVMKSAISVWSAKNQYTFEHVAKIYEASYSPIENYDRYEDMSTNRDRRMDDDTTNNTQKTEIISSGNTVTNDLTRTDDLTTQHSGKDSTVDENTTSAYDASTYQPENKSTSDLTHGEKVTDTGTVKNTGSVTTNASSNKGDNANSTTNKDVTENEKTTQNNHIRGNIGVTTADAMQIEEYNFLSKYNPYTFISGLFENDLTLFVY